MIHKDEMGVMLSAGSERIRKHINDAHVLVGLRQVVSEYEDKLRVRKQAKARMSLNL